MPQVTVYIRQEDLSAWQALEKKSEFIHRALMNNTVEKTWKEAKKEILKDPKTASEYSGTETVVIQGKKISYPVKTAPYGTTEFKKAQVYGVCKFHGPLDYRGKCLVKGCKNA